MDTFSSPSDPLGAEVLLLLVSGDIPETVTDGNLDSE